MKLPPVLICAPQNACKIKVFGLYSVLSDFSEGENRDDIGQENVIMLYNLLAEESKNFWQQYGSIILIVVLVAVMIVVMVLMSRRSKKQRQEAEDLINAVKPGNKVKTIGGVCGIVVEVDPEENTFVLETGSETSGKCYMKFDRQAILQSDAVIEKPDSKPEQPAEEPFEEQQSPAEDAPAEEQVKPEDKAE